MLHEAWPLNSKNWFLSNYKVVFGFQIPLGIESPVGSQAQRRSTKPVVASFGWLKESINFVKPTPPLGTKFSVLEGHFLEPRNLGLGS